MVVSKLLKKSTLIFGVLLSTVLLGSSSTVWGQDYSENPKIVVENHFEEFSFDFLNGLDRAIETNALIGPRLPNGSFHGSESDDSNENDERHIESGVLIGPRLPNGSFYGAESDDSNENDERHIESGALIGPRLPNGSFHGKEKEKSDENQLATALQKIIDNATNDQKQRLINTHSTDAYLREAIKIEEEQRQYIDRYVKLYNQLITLSEEDQLELYRLKDNHEALIQNVASIVAEDKQREQLSDTLIYLLDHADSQDLAELKRLESLDDVVKQFVLMAIKHDIRLQDNELMTPFRGLSIHRHVLGDFYGAGSIRNSSGGGAGFGALATSAVKAAMSYSKNVVNHLSRAMSVGASYTLGVLSAPKVNSKINVPVSSSVTVNDLLQPIRYSSWLDSLVYRSRSSIALDLPRVPAIPYPRILFPDMPAIPLPKVKDYVVSVAGEVAGNVWVGEEVKRKEKSLTAENQINKTNGLRELGEDTLTLLAGVVIAYDLDIECIKQLDGVMDYFIKQGQRAAIEALLKLLPVTPVEPTANYKVVKPGDSVWRIAYNAKISMEDLIKWNNIKNYTIHPGQLLRLTPTPQTSSYTTYTVKPGESVWRISYNHGMTMDELIALNGIKNNTIHPGQVLRVKTPSDQLVSANLTQPIYQTVKAGDSVWRIAHNNGISMSDLIKWNGIQNYTIHPGQRLYVGSKENEHVIAGIAGKCSKKREKRKLNEMSNREIASLTSVDEMLERLPKGWVLYNNDGRVHVKAPGSRDNYFLRVDPADKDTPYQHLHFYDISLPKGKNSLDIDGNIVDKNSKEAHIPWSGSNDVIGRIHHGH